MAPKTCSYKMGNYTGPVPIHLHHIAQISCAPKLCLLTCTSARKVYWVGAGNASSMKERPPYQGSKQETTQN